MEKRHLAKTSSSCLTGAVTEVKVCGCQCGEKGDMHTLPVTPSHYQATNFKLEKLTGTKRSQLIPGMRSVTLTCPLGGRKGTASLFSLFPKTHILNLI